MGWHAKPSGPYDMGTIENEENTLEINGILNGYGFSVESQIGILANCQAESQLNPWRLEGPDSPNWTSGMGYGLYQFTPGWQYIEGCIDFPGYGPNTTIHTTLPTARPEDGYAQTMALAEDSLEKWTVYAWRDSWDRNAYPYMWQLCSEGVARWGSNGRITLAQYKTVDEPNYATAIFLACYEGPSVPNIQTRLSFVPYFASIVSPDTPVPPPPEPFNPHGNSFKIMFYLKSKRRRFYGY